VELSAATLRRSLRRQLSAYFKVESLGGAFVSEEAGPLAPSGFRLADAVVRRLVPLALEAQEMAGAAEGLRGIAPLTDRAACFKAMTANEKVARTNDAPPVLVKAVGGVASTAIMLGDAATTGSEEKTARAIEQLSSAVLRVVAICIPLVPDRAALLEVLSGWAASP
jgi:hypothetical protein